MARNSSKPYPIARGLCKLSPSSSKKDGFPQLKPSTTLARLGKNPMDAYLKEVMRYLKEPFEVLPEIITRIEVTFNGHSAEGIQQFKVEIIEIRQMNMIMKNPTMLYALGILNQGLLQSIFLLNAVSSQLDTVGSDPEFDEDEIAKLTKLKERLLTLTEFLDGILMYYSNSCMGCKAPVVDKVKRIAKKLYKVINSIKPDKLHRLIPNIVVTEEDILCSALGLQRDVACKLQELSPELQNHQTDMYFLLRFLEERAEYSESLTDTDMASKLQEMGFTEYRSDVIAKWIAEQPFPEHQSLLAWAQHYIESLFKYDIFLNDCVPKYPYEEKTLNKWFDKSVDRDKDDDGGDDDDGGGGGGGGGDCDGVVTSNVRIINTTRDTPKDTSRLIDEMLKQIREQQPGKFYYHGTDHKGAKSILEDGINLEVGKLSCDFSNGVGFYLTESHDYAKEWSEQSDASAVLVFNISESQLKEHRYLDLSENKSDWQSVIDFNRKNVALPRKLKNKYRTCYYIKGPTSRDGSKKNPGVVYEQICIKKKAMANSIGNPANICAVIFKNRY